MSKLISDLTKDEAKKECVQFGLVSEGEKVSLGLCIVKLVEYLEESGFSSSTYKFSPKDPMEQEVAVANQFKKRKRRRNNLPPSNTNSNNLPPGWEILNNPQTGSPVGMLDPGGRFLELEEDCG